MPPTWTKRGAETEKSDKGGVSAGLRGGRGESARV